MYGDPRLCVMLLKNLHEEGNFQQAYSNDIEAQNPDLMADLKIRVGQKFVEFRGKIDQLNNALAQFIEADNYDVSILSFL